MIVAREGVQLRVCEQVVLQDRGGKLGVGEAVGDADEGDERGGEVGEGVGEGVEVEVEVWTARWYLEAEGDLVFVTRAGRRGRERGEVGVVRVD